MVANPSLWMYFANAGPVVKSVMLLLLGASVLSWTFIFQRAFFLKRAATNAKKFEDQFWAGSDLAKLYAHIDSRTEEQRGLAHIFHAGFKEFIRLSKQVAPDPSVIMDGVQRAMRIAHSRETEQLEKHLPFLASVGSTSPYIGLFGTVWGIMTAFHALGQVQQATIAMVAPGISEALVATAMGLFAAIPAVLAYNRYVSHVDQLSQQYETFQDEFSSILHRQSHGGE